MAIVKKKKRSPAGSTSARTRAALRRCRDQLEATKSKIRDIGFVMQGSVVRRTKRCGQPGCSCHLGPEYEHGPYYQWTKKVQAKTVTKVLTPTEARLVEECIRNGRRLKKQVSKMYAISARAMRYLSDK